jgi:uncharacterized membrane protein YheB (UPF0754 family)
MTEADMDFKLDDQALKSVLSKSIMDILTPEKREEIIGKAVERLLATKTSDRYDAPTTLQAAFDAAVRDVAQTVAVEMLRQDAALRDKIKAMFYAAWEKQTTGENEANLVEKISNAIEKAFSNERY